MQKVSVDAGFTCPNVDGTVAVGGCTFCDNRSFSPSRRLPRLRHLRARSTTASAGSSGGTSVDQFIAYFQPATNTYAPVERLRPLYEQALAHPQVVGLAIGTRPDCVPDDVLDLLAEIWPAARISRVEYGLQTIHDRSLDWMNRGHHHDAFVDAIDRSRGRGFEICAHVILGLPGESHDDMLATAREVARLRLDAVKIHNLYAVQGHAAGRPGRARRSDADGARRVHSHARRFSGAAAAGRWSSSGSAATPRPTISSARPGASTRIGIRAALEAEFARRNTWQGRLWT